MCIKVTRGGTAPDDYSFEPGERGVGGQPGQFKAMGGQGVDRALGIVHRCITHLGSCLPVTGRATRHDPLAWPLGTAACTTRGGISLHQHEESRTRSLMTFRRGPPHAIQLEREAHQR
jgi:hypothetical protein